MSGGNRDGFYTALAVLLCVAAGVLAFSTIFAIGDLAGHESERRDQTPASYRQAARADAQNACVGADRLVLFECVYDKVEASAQQAHDEQDLSAQQRAASAALIAAISSLLGIGVSIVGIYFIRRTIQQGQQGLERAREANEISEMAAQRQLRAYLSVVGVRVDTISLPIEIHLDIVNHGTTPAKITDVRMSAWIGPRNVLNPRAEGPAPREAVMYKRSLGRDQSDRVIIFERPDNIPQLGADGHDFYVYGRVDYEDVFGTPHWVAFAYTPRGYSVGDGEVLGPCIGGNETSDHNG